jgi:hypothetical protein
MWFLRANGWARVWELEIQSLNQTLHPIAEPADQATTAVTVSSPQKSVNCHSEIPTRGEEIAGDAARRKIGAAPMEQGVPLNGIKDAEGSIQSKTSIRLNEPESTEYTVFKKVDDRNECWNILETVRDGATVQSLRGFSK